jgi:aspartate aminotransferase-like enzyme
VTKLTPLPSPPPLRFKIATEPSELEAIRRLNYRTFVDEIPQHSPNGDGVLVDRFDAENTYVVCLQGKQLVGMVAVRGKRPFSLDDKLPELDSHLPPGRSLCEVRLLAVEPAHRTGAVFVGLTRCLAQHCLREGYDLALISGTVRQLKLYQHIGFVPFGPLVGTADAPYQPMYLTLETFREKGDAFVQRVPESTLISYLPGPVEMEPAVRRAMRMVPVSHRGVPFLSELAEARRALCTLTGARRVQLLLGSGTLGNDTVAAQLALLGGRGLVLSNGEFGNRLADHASRWELDYLFVQEEWGSILSRKIIEAALDRDSSIKWVWAVHCETSTGVLNDLGLLREICAERGVRLCLDCISSVGAVPVDLHGIYLATGVSGKALGAPAGIALVFHNHEIRASDTLPRYLDLGLYAQTEGSPFTHSSNLLRALYAAVIRIGKKGVPSAAVMEDAAWMRDELRSHGFRILAPDDVTSPAVTTVVLPRGVSAEEFGARLEDEGFAVSYRSEYLQTRNWVQICLMGSYRRDCLRSLVAAFSNPGKPSAAAS